MKNLLLITLALALSACSNQEQEWDVVNFPLYEECDYLLEKINGKLSINSETYEFQITKSEFGERPKFGHIPYGLGSLKVRGDLKLLNGSQEEYLQLQLAGMFAECMPNNAMVFSGSDVPSQIESRFGSKLLSGSAENGKFYVLYNDGSYSYE